MQIAVNLDECFLRHIFRVCLASQQHEEHYIDRALDWTNQFVKEMRFAGQDSDDKCRRRFPFGGSGFDFACQSWFLQDTSLPEIRDMSIHLKLYRCIEAQMSYMRVSCRRKVQRNDAAARIFGAWSLARQPIWGRGE